MEITSVSLIYILTRLGKRILDFFRHWYVDGFLKASDLSLGVLERLDRIFALRITFKNLFQPLYQDYSLIGYLLGFIFRTARILAALAIYGAFISICAFLFLIWAGTPIYAMYQILINF